MDWITVLTKEVGINKEVSLVKMYEACKKDLEESVTKEDFLLEITAYLKKKVKNFEITKLETIVIRHYTCAEIPQLFRYFKLGNFVQSDGKSKQISISLMYECWKLKEAKSKKEFKSELIKYLTTHFGAKGYFIFSDTLTIHLK